MKPSLVAEASSATTVIDDGEFVDADLTIPSLAETGLRVAVHGDFGGELTGLYTNGRSFGFMLNGVSQTAADYDRLARQLLGRRRP